LKGKGKAQAKDMDVDKVIVVDNAKDESGEEWDGIS